MFREENIKTILYEKFNFVPAKKIVQYVLDFFHFRHVMKLAKSNEFELRKWGKCWGGLSSKWSYSRSQAHICKQMKVVFSFYKNVQMNTPIAFAQYRTMTAYRGNRNVIEDKGTRAGGTVNWHRDSAAAWINYQSLKRCQNRLFWHQRFELS